VRETLFNWLAAHVSGARCLDLFAGSGALGLEALSRGAAHVTFIERDATAVRELRDRLREWGATGAQVEHGDAVRYLSGNSQSFDVVFLDPPFAANLLPAVVPLLEERGWLRAGALIYIETDAHADLPPLPANWRPTKAKQAGAVGYHLLVRD
jgi:16S rRNA (guanine966-N2)-methyltransferase